MKVRVAYTIDVPDELRRAINHYWGRPGLATRAEVADWYRAHGSSEDDNLFHDLESARERGEA